MASHRAWVFLLAISIASLVGCASTPEQTGYLKNYNDLQAGEHVDGIRVSPGFQISKYSAIMVHAATPLKHPIRQAALDSYVGYLQREMIVQLQRSGYVAEVMDGGQGTPSPINALRCELAITELDPGSQAMRWFMGEFGAGHSVIQVEGRISDAQTDQELVTFVERRRGAAVFDITGGDSQALIEQDLRETARMFVQELASYR